MVACALAPWALGLMGPIYGITALVLNAVFLLMAAHVAFRQTGVDDPMRAEKALFAFSILYLFVLFAAVAADAMVHA
jgi:protoheme IX farnesyltransferase